MKIKAYIFVVLALALILAPLAVEGRANSAQNREYQIKAAFLYNFIKFVDWPKDKVADGNEPITIGIIGKSPFGNAFEPLKSKKVKGRNVAVKQFKSFEELKKSGEKDKSEFDREIEDLRKCYLLFICPSEKNNLTEIIDSVEDNSILTVGDTKGFLEAGGIINFLMEEEKLRFEINVTAAENAKLEFRSKLLRLAKRVVGEKSSGEQEN